MKNDTNPVQIIQEIHAISGSNAKTQALSKYADNELLVRILENTYSPYKKFYIQNIPTVKPNEVDRISVELAVTLAETLPENRGNKAQEILKRILMDLSKDTGMVIQNMIKGSQKGGFGRTMINKALGRELIRKEPYMGAQSFTLSKVQKLINSGKKLCSQLKVDGRYANVHVKATEDENGFKVSADSRQGLPNLFNGALEGLSEIQALLGMDVTLNGELTVRGFNRYKGNGIINSLVVIGNKMKEGKDVSKYKKDLVDDVDVNMTYEELLSRLTYTVWDFIPFENYSTGQDYESPYSERMSKLERAVKILNKPDLIEFVETRIITNMQEALDHFYENFDKGLEGTILKSMDDIWSAGKPSYQLKFKQEISLDLLVVGYEYGEKGKSNEHLISSLLVESSDGLLKARVSNMTQSLMKEITKKPESLVSKIIEVTCSGLSYTGGEFVALQHPRFSCFRDDTTVKSLAECREVDSSARILSND